MGAFPTRVRSFTYTGRTGIKAKYLGQLDSPGGSTGWLGQLGSGEARYAGNEGLERPYEEMPWVHVALKALSSAVRSCPLRFYREDPKENPEAPPVEPEHALYKLFKSPNPLMAGPTFMEAGLLHRKLCGEDFWFLFDDKKNPITVDLSSEGPKFDYPSMIIPVRGELVEMRPDHFGFPRHWVYPTNQQQKLLFTPDQIVHFRDYDPHNPTRGMGDVQALTRVLGLEFQAHRYQEALLRNSGDPGGYIIIDDEASREEIESLEQEAEDKFSTVNKGRWRVINGMNVKYEPAKFGPRDMEYQELQAQNRQAVSAGLGVNLPVMGVLDEATYSNYSIAVKQFWENGNGVLSYLSSVEDTINIGFLPRLKDSQAAKFVARFDTSHVEALKEDKSDRLTLAKELADGQLGLSFDEAAALVGLRETETEFGHIAWLPPNVTTAEEALNHAEDQLENGRTEDLMGQPPTGTGADGASDFPGSNDFDSGSNGPTGSDGKQAGPVQTRGDDATAHQVKGQPSPYFKSFEAGVLAPGERRVQKVMRDYLASYQHAQLKRIEDYANRRPEDMRGAETKDGLVSPADLLKDAELFNVVLLEYTEWVQKLADKMQVPLSDIVNAAASDISAQIGGDPITANDPWALDFLGKQRIRLAEGVNSTLAKKVREAIIEVFEKQPFEMAPLREHIRRLLPELKGSLKKAFASRSARASAIARTEVNRAANGARYEEMRREGIDKHRWVTSGDNHVRSKAPHSHEVLDGQVRPVGDTFREGFSLRHPGDPEGAPQDVINCRCVTQPILED